LSVLSIEQVVVEELSLEEGLNTCAQRAARLEGEPYFYLEIGEPSFLGELGDEHSVVRSGVAEALPGIDD
jgi:hypothetical protein